MKINCGSYYRQPPTKSRVYLAKKLTQLFQSKDVESN